MKIKGHTDIILTNVKTGEVERHSDDNMVTNAIAEYLANCGFLNANNVDQDNMVVKLLGGVMAFDEPLTESATIVKVPGGFAMIANGCVGVDNDSEVLECGSFSDSESGWQQDGSYVQTYDYSTSQANGKISCVCLTGQDYGYMGEGNSLSGLNRLSPRNLTQVGNVTEYSITGFPCRLSVSDSSVYGIDFSDIANSNITIRKYRLPLTKVNLKGTKSAPALLSETTITAPSSLVTEWSGISYDNGCIEDNEGILSILSMPTSSGWGSGYTQYLWEIDPVNATIVESTLSNTSGDDLYGIFLPMWMGKDCLAWINGYGRDGWYNDARYIYSMKRTNGVWSNIQKCENAFGTYNSMFRSAGWSYRFRSADDRVLIYGQKWNGSTYEYAILNFDYTANKIYMTNGMTQQSLMYHRSADKPLVKYWGRSLGDNAYGININRDETYIATINNLATPVQKTPEKTMKIVYRLTFTDQ